MNTTFRLLIGASLLAGTFGVALRAASPDQATSPAETASGDTCPGLLSAGHILLLENMRVLEGDIERDGDRYRIRRNLGESYVPADQVLRLCADVEDAYQYLRGRANLRDPDERLKLAGWCQLHGLKEHGLAEANAALQLRPASSEAQRMVRSLKRALEADMAPPVTPPEPVPTAEPQAAVVPLNINLTTEALTTFSRRVQPILMNTCASCHVTERGGAFKLIRVTDDGSQNRRTTQQNLAAVVAQINLDNWPASPLLNKAISVHGDTGQAPLKGRDAPAFKALEEWVQQAAANASPRETAAPTSVPASTPPSAAAVSTTPAATPKPSPLVTGNAAIASPEPATTANKEPTSNTREQWAVDSPAKPAKQPTPASAPDHAANDAPANRREQWAVDSPTKPAKQPTSSADHASGDEAKTNSAGSASAEPADPFDPVIFNRQMHPNR